VAASDHAPQQCEASNLVLVRIGFVRAKLRLNPFELLDGDDDLCSPGYALPLWTIRPLYLRLVISSYTLSYVPGFFRWPLRVPPFTSDD
jgi:hypothetical protein